VAALLVSLTGCNQKPADDPGGPEGSFRVATVDVDGRQVVCITWADSYKGGISCDWEGAR
jgi:hypothetical protein